MKYKLKYIIIPIICLILVSGIVLAGLHFKRLMLVQSYIDKLEECIEDGDIICRLGDRIWSLYFKGLSSTDKRFSHLGIIHRNENGIFVVNSEGLTHDDEDFVKEVSLYEFITSARIVGIYRMNDIEGQYISQEALKMLGRPFDWNFNLHNSDKLYCTELLYVVLQNIAPEIELTTIHKLGKDIVPLEAVSDSSLFKEIIFLE
jgi:hypothetical protein